MTHKELYTFTDFRLALASSSALCIEGPSGLQSQPRLLSDATAVADWAKQMQTWERARRLAEPPKISPVLFCGNGGGVRSGFSFLSAPRQTPAGDQSGVRGGSDSAIASASAAGRDAAGSR